MLFNFIDLLRAVAVLDNSHMVTSGSIIIRSMFEIILDFLYCETNRKKLYERFGKYQYVNKVNLYNILPDYLKVDVNKDSRGNETIIFSMLPEANESKEDFTKRCMQRASDLIKNIWNVDDPELCNYDDQEDEPIIYPSNPIVDTALPVFRSNIVQ